MSTPTMPTEAPARELLHSPQGLALHLAGLGRELARECERQTEHQARLELTIMQQAARIEELEAMLAGRRARTRKRKRPGRARAKAAA